MVDLAALEKLKVSLVAIVLAHLTILSRELECIQDESYNKCSTCTCNSTARTPKCFISRKIMKETVLISRGCIYQPPNKFVTEESQCDSMTNSHVQCCSDKNYCNNVSVPEDIGTAVSPGTDLGYSSSSEVFMFSGSGSSVSTPDGEQKRSSLVSHVVVPVVICVAVVTLFLVSIMVVSFCFTRKKFKRKTTSPSSVPPDLSCDCHTLTSGSGHGQVKISLRTIGQSVLVSDVVGEGRFGRVLTGYYQGELVAMKKFISREEESWRREKEVYELGLSHRNILNFVASDIISSDGATELCLITQYHPHGSLYDYLHSNTVTMAEMMVMSVSILRGLVHLHTPILGTSHKSAIAHRDLKSDNVLVKQDLECCLCDFGHSVIEAGDNRVRRPVSMLQGSRRYMAPEILGETMDINAFDAYLEVDVYALGLVLWELVTRCDLEDNCKVFSEYVPPFHTYVPANPSIEDMKRTVVHEKRCPLVPSAWMEHKVLSSLVDLMRECWCHNSKARPSSAFINSKLIQYQNSLSDTKHL